MKRLEIIGTSGVGKTTLYRKICNFSKSKRSYYTLNEAYKYAALSYKVPLTEIKSQIFKTLLRLNLLKSRELGLSIRSLDLKNTKKKWIAKSDYMNFQLSFMSLYHYLSSEKNPYIVKARIEKFISTIEEFLILNHLIPEYEKVLFDEGMIHHVEDLSYNILANFSEIELKKDTLFNPAGIILCEQTPEIIFNQALKRKNNGILTLTHGSLSDSQLYKHIIREVAFYDRKAAFFKKLGLPVLHINTGSDDGINLNLINEFINEIN